MATVTMDLTEVEALKQAVVTAKESAKVEADKLKELEKEMALTKADKRVMKVTKTINQSIDRSSIQHEVSKALHEHRNSRSGIHQSIDYSYIGGRIVDSFSSRYNIMTYGYSDESTNEKTEFVNFEDVKETLRKEIDQELRNEIAILQSKVKYQDDNIASVREEARRTLEKNSSDYLQKISDLNDNLSKQMQEYQDLKEDKDMRTTENKLLDEIAELKKELQEQKNKKWYQR